MNIGFFGLLTILFVIAKITGYVAWSWWLVFSPMFVGLLFVFVIAALAVWANK